MYIEIKILYDDMLTEFSSQLVYSICIQFDTCDIQ